MSHEFAIVFIKDQKEDESFIRGFTTLDRFTIAMPREK